MWIELLFTVNRDEVEAWSDALLECGALSVQAEDADADSPDEQALFGEPGEPVAAPGWARTRLAALLEADARPEQVIQRAAECCGLEPPERTDTRTLADQDWVRLTQSQFSPIPIGQRLLILPSWHLDQVEAAAASGRESIVLDPGLAFGTGSHPTTAMCLEWIDARLRSGQSLIDYGCGSGILAIAAARLGAVPVRATDIDPQALSSAQDNARLNGVRIEWIAAGQAVVGPADIVIANILANPLRLLAPLLTDLVRPGGTLVLSGLLERQVDELRALYPEVALEVFRVREGWACLAGARRR